MISGCLYPAIFWVGYNTMGKIEITVIPPLKSAYYPVILSTFTYIVMLLKYPYLVIKIYNFYFLVNIINSNLNKLLLNLSLKYHFFMIKHVYFINYVT